jgi:hypothetical protein
MRLPLRSAGLALALAASAAVVLAARQSTTPRPAATQPRPAPAAKTAPATPAAPAKVSTPPLNTTGYAGARPQGITRAVYDFAAQHPEVLKYVPCYCGCESDGHPHNESCFVKARDPKGNVTQWDMHGYG